MTAIVVNTMNGAVTEYTGFDFHAITPTHAGSVLGLYLLGGNTDITATIVASAVTGKTLWGAAAKKFLDCVYFSIKGNGINRLSVIGESATYTYDFEVLPAGESRAITGRGIRENYLAFGYSNTNGAAFEIDRIEPNVAQSKTRRI